MNPEMPTVEQDPFRIEDDTWIGMPSSVEDRGAPALDPESSPFWEGLRSSEIVFQRCTSCRRYTHFPVGGCQWCGGQVVFETVPNADMVATVDTFAACYLEFGPGMEVPYLAAIVNPACEPEIHLMTNLVNVRICDVRAGMRVRPRFVHGAERSLLFYEPVGTAGSSSELDVGSNPDETSAGG